MQTGYRLTRKPPIPSQVFSGCVKPNQSMTVEQMYNSTLKKPPPKPQLPHDALKAVVKKDPPPVVDESVMITDTRSFFELTKKKAEATSARLEQLLMSWERILTEALRDKLMDEEERHMMEVPVAIIWHQIIKILLKY